MATLNVMTPTIVQDATRLTSLLHLITDPEQMQKLLGDLTALIEEQKTTQAEAEQRIVEATKAEDKAIEHEGTLRAKATGLAELEAKLSRQSAALTAKAAEQEARAGELEKLRVQLAELKTQHESVAAALAPRERAAGEKERALIDRERKLEATETDWAARVTRFRQLASDQPPMGDQRAAGPR